MSCKLPHPLDSVKISAINVANIKQLAFRAHCSYHLFLTFNHFSIMYLVLYCSISGLGHTEPYSETYVENYFFFKFQPDSDSANECQWSALMRVHCLKPQLLQL